MVWDILFVSLSLSLSSLVVISRRHLFARFSTSRKEKRHHSDHSISVRYVSFGEGRQLSTPLQMNMFHLQIIHLQRKENDLPPNLQKKICSKCESPRSDTCLYIEASTTLTTGLKITRPEPRMWGCNGNVGTSPKPVEVNDRTTTSRQQLRVYVVKEKARAPEKRLDWYPAKVICFAPLRFGIYLGPG